MAIDRLQNYLKLRTHVPKQTNGEEADIQIKQAEAQWAASHFFANVLVTSQSPEGEISESEFEKFKTRYESANGISIDANLIFESYWLRKVLGFIELPRAVSSLCLSIERWKSKKDLIEFLCSFYTTVDDRYCVKKEEFETALNTYNESKSASIDFNELTEGHWVTTRKDKIEMHDMDRVYAPVLKNWNEWMFLVAFKDYKNSISDKGLNINRSDFLRVYEAHSTYFTSTPTIEEMIGQGFLKETETGYIVNFYKSSVHYWSGLSDQIAGLYWESLVRSTTEENDQESLTEFLCKIFSCAEWTRNMLSNVSQAAKIRFLNAAYELVTSSEDLLGTDAEFAKVKVDNGYDEFSIFQIDKLHEYYPKLNGNLFEIFQGFRIWKEIDKGSLLYDQHSRRKLQFLISQIIGFDLETENGSLNPDKPHSRQHFMRINGLLDQSHNRPFLVWSITNGIAQSRVDFIPYMLLEPKLTSLAFCCLGHLNLVFEEERSQLTRTIWLKCMDLALPSLRSDSVTRKDAARIVFEIYRVLNKDKYRVSYSRPTANEEKQLKAEHLLWEELVLKKIEDSLRFNHRVFGQSPEYLLPSIFDELTNLFIEYEEPDIYRNQTVQFPMLKWNGLIWLMKCSSYWKFNSDNKDVRQWKLAKCFMDGYLSLMEQNTTKHYRFLEDDIVDATPLWSEKIERLDRMDWIYPIYFINEHGVLNQFLSPRFTFVSAKDSYHEYNKYNAEKLRTHIGVLLNVLRTFVLPTLPYGFDRNTIKEAKGRIEKEIAQNIKQHSKDVPSKRRIDLFDHMKEWGFNRGDKEALLPQIAVALNWFDDKEVIIKAITDSQDVNKILTLAEWVTSGGIRETLIQRVKSIDLAKYFESLQKSFRGSEIQPVLVHIRQHHDLKEQVKEAASFWETNVSEKNPAYKSELYQTKLMLAYFEGSETELDAVEISQKQHSSPSEFSPDDYKQFYRGLIRFKTDTESAYSIFNDLSTKHPNYPVLAVNRMAAKIRMATAQDNTDMYREALSEWVDYAELNKPIDEQGLGVAFLSNKFEALLKLDEHEKLDKEYHKLDLPHQMLPDLLKCRIEGFVRQNRFEQALSLLEEARNYHNYNGQGAEFLQTLEASISGKDVVEILSGYYSKVFGSTPGTLVKVLPPNQNGSTNLKEFMAKEVVLAGCEMLNKIFALPTIAKLKNTSKENRYTDLVQLALGSRLSAYGWSTGTQERKAFSAGMKDLGEIDLNIKGINRRTLMTCEAFRFVSKATVQSHLKKLIGHYTHDRDRLLTLIYHDKPHAKFEINWKKYTQEWIPNLKFPKDYTLIGDQLEDVTDQFEFNHSAIKVGKMSFTNGIIIYHVFVGVNYILKD